MKEAQENVARLPELAPSDFDRVCEFAYGSDYTSPMSLQYDSEIIEMEANRHSLSGAISRRQIDGSAAWLLRQFIYKRFGDNALLFYEDRVTDEGYWPLDRHVNGWISEDLPVLGNDGAFHPREQNVKDVLLRHATLYIFAEKYLIPELKDLALHNLHKFLTNLQIWSLTRGHVIELLQYAYDTDNISDRDESSAVDPLRVCWLSSSGCMDGRSAGLMYTGKC